MQSYDSGAASSPGSGKALLGLAHRPCGLRTHAHTQVTQLGDKQFRLALEDCLAFGKPLLIENIEEELDPVLDPVLERRLVSAVWARVCVCVCVHGVCACVCVHLSVDWLHPLASGAATPPSVLAPQVRKGKSWVVQLADKEVDFADTFKLFCTTRLPNPHFSPELSAKVTVVDFTVTMAGALTGGHAALVHSFLHAGRVPPAVSAPPAAVPAAPLPFLKLRNPFTHYTPHAWRPMTPGLEDQLLGKLILKEKHELEEQRQALLEEVQSYKKKIKQLEDDLLFRRGGGGRMGLVGGTLAR